MSVITDPEIQHIHWKLVSNSNLAKYRLFITYISVAQSSHDLTLTTLHEISKRLGKWKVDLAKFEFNISFGEMTCIAANPSFC